MENKQPRKQPVPTARPESDWRRVAHGRPYAERREPDIELRSNPRKTIPIEVVLNYGLTHSEVVPIRDLTMGGVFVEMTAVELHEGALLELLLRYRYKDRHIEHRLPAQVVRVTPDGVALRFGDYDDDAYTDLVDLLYAM